MEVEPGEALEEVCAGSAPPRPKRLLKKGMGKAAPLPKCVVQNVLVHTPDLKEGLQGLSSLYTRKSKQRIYISKCSVDSDNENLLGNKTVYRKENVNVGSSVVAAGTARPSGQSGEGGASHAVCRMLRSGVSHLVPPPPIAISAASSHSSVVVGMFVPQVPRQLVPGGAPRKNLPPLWRCLRRRPEVALNLWVSGPCLPLESLGAPGRRPALSLLLSRIRRVERESRTCR